MERSAAVYLRVSTDKQSVENQRPDLCRLAKVRGLNIVESYEEQQSAVKHRPAFEALMADARKGKFETLLVWRLDRFGRSMQGNVNDVLELDRIGITVVSAMEPFLDSSGPARNLLLAIFSWLAEEEREILIERTKAGIERARRQGKVIGRPRVAPFRLKNAAQEVKDGASLRVAASHHDIGAETLRRFLLGQRKSGSASTT